MLTASYQEKDSFEMFMSYCENAQRIQAALDKSLAMQLFATFLLIIALYDVVFTMRNRLDREIAMARVIVRGYTAQ